MGIDIDGKTRLLGLMGDPVEHTLSPVIHNTLSEILGLNNVYVPFHVKKEGLAKAVEGAFQLNILGLNVTVPHKNDVIASLCSVSDEGLAIGAVNTLVRTENGYRGYNTDMLGLTREIKSYGIELVGRKVIILGAGGAAKAVAYMCMAEKASDIYILNRTLEKATEIAEHMNSFFGRQTIRAMKLSDWRELVKNRSDRDKSSENKAGGNEAGGNGTDEIVFSEKYIVIQSTSIGLKPDNDRAVIEDEDFYRMIDTGVDLIYSPFETKFMKLCRRNGAKAYNGLKMLLYQGIIAYELWNDISVSEEVADRVYEVLEKNARNNTVLTGFMGCGKSTVGKRLAKATGRDFLDVDKYIVDKAGCSISRIFAEHGEEYFRALETEALNEIYNTVTGTVISTGGGLPMRKVNRDILNRLGEVVYLDVSPDCVYERLKDDTTRPLLQSENPMERIEELLGFRRPVYLDGADRTVNVSYRTVEDIIKDIID